MVKGEGHGEARRSDGLVCVGGGRVVKGEKTGSSEQEHKL